MKRREFLIITVLTGAFLAAPIIYPSSKENKSVFGINPLRFPPELQAESH